MEKKREEGKKAGTNEAREVRKNQRWRRKQKSNGNQAGIWSGGKGGKKVACC